jgi:hypothetical protein
MVCLKVWVCFSCHVATVDRVSDYSEYWGGGGLQALYLPRTRKNVGLFRNTGFLMYDTANMFLRVCRQVGAYAELTSVV